MESRENYQKTYDGLVSLQEFLILKAQASPSDNLKWLIENTNKAIDLIEYGG